jgi:serine/arginine repetitive matrix protein 2
MIHYLRDNDAHLVYATGKQLGKQIAPWPVSPPKLRPIPSAIQTQARPKPITETPPGWRPSHRRTLSPPGPVADPPTIFKPLSPPFVPTTKKSGTSHSPGTSVDGTPLASGHKHTPSSLTFGKPPTKVANRLDVGDESAEASPSPVFRKTVAHGRNRSSEIPPAQRSPKDSNGMPLAPDAKRGLGLTGTMGGSVASGMTAKDVDPEDPDSDIPDELQVILSGQSDEETTSFGETMTRRLQNVAPQRLPSPGLPPQLPLPIPDVDTSSPPTLQVPMFEAFITGPNGSCPSSPASASEDDTKKSFDFTGELKKLNESGASDRRSFVEQLESAFRTPAKVDLRGFGDFLGVTDVPPVPKLPDYATQVQLNTLSPETESSDSSAGVHSEIHVDTTTTEESSVNQSIVFSELQGLVVEAELLNPLPSMEVTHSHSSLHSKPSDGRLDVNFRFGGKSSLPSPSSILEESPALEHRLTLSDIIPPPSHVRALSTSVVEEDSEVLKSIYAKAAEVDAADSRIRVDSTTSFKRRARDMAMASLTGAIGHKRGVSEASFAGFDSFEEVRRGFEFGPNRPAFYPVQSARATKRTHGREESVFSIASISSYGSVINAGSRDPFGFIAPNMPSRPPSMDMSISMSTMDDTFSFLKQDPRRKRVDSDASSFYFQASHASHRMSFARSHRRDESNFSISSLAPPISLYNRSFGHRRNDSGSSSSVAFSYAMHGANGGRAAWARHHRQDASIDSSRSNFSAARLGRPGLGDKMLDSAPMDHGTSLSAISGSPAESIRSFVSESLSPVDRSSYDSIMDEERKTTLEDSLFDKTGLRTSMFERKTMMDDSLFDKTGHRSSSPSEESVFGADNSGIPPLLPAWRPVSVLSYGSPRSAPEEDDTMVTVSPL